MVRAVSALGFGILIFLGGITFLFAADAAPSPAPAAAAQKEAPKSAKGSDDVCLNERTFVKSDGTIQFDTTTPPEQYKICKGNPTATPPVPECTWARDTNNPKATGTPRCTCGVATFMAPSADGKVAEPLKGMPPISKCDPDKEKQRQKILTGELNAKSRELLQSAVAKQNFTGLTNNQPMTAEQKAIFGAFGIEEAKAVEMAKKDPEATKNLLSALASGDTTAANTSAQKLGLSQAEFSMLQNQAALLSPDAAIEAAKYSDPQGAKVLAQDLCRDTGRCYNTTFVNPGVAPAQIEADRKFRQEVDPFVDRLRGNGCNPSAMSCRTNNPGALTYGPRAAKFGGYSCGQSNDTACFPNAELGTAAMVDLVKHNVEKGCASIYSILEDCRYSSSRDGNNSYKYAQTVSQWTGIGMNERIDPNNAAQMAKVVAAMARYESGHGLAFNGRELQSAMGYAYGTKELPTGTAGFQGGYVNSQGGMYSSPFGASGLGGLFGGGAGGMNVFGGTGGAFGSTGGAVGRGGQQSGVPLNSGPFGYTAQQQYPAINAYAASLKAGTVTGASAAATKGPAVATLLVQPSTVLPGQPFTVSWTSLNMHETQTCKVSYLRDGVNTLISTGNNGSEKLSLSQLAGTFEILLTCTPKEGAAIEKKAQVTIQ